MNLDSQSFALNQLNYLVHTVTKKTTDHCLREVDKIVSSYGLEARRHLIRLLLAKIPLRSSSGSSPSKGGAGTNSSAADAFVQQLLTQYLSDRQAGNNLVWCLENPLGTDLSPSLVQLFTAAKVTFLQEICLCISIFESSKSKDLKNAATKLIKDHFTVFYEKTKNLIEAEKFSEQFHQILRYLSNPETAKDLDSALLQSIPKHISSFLNGDIPLILNPLLKKSSDWIEPDSIMSGKGNIDLLKDALPELVQEMGYRFTSSVAECRASLMRFHGPEPCGANTIAKVLTVMVRTHTGLDDSTMPLSLPHSGKSWDSNEKDKQDKTWNIEVFVQSIHDLNKTLNWKEILFELDNPHFLVKDRAGLILLIKALKLGFQMQGVKGHFPMDMFYRHWKYPEGQMSLFNQILRNPDVICFAEHQYHDSATEILKVTPDFTNKEIATWRSLDLIETLLHLADSNFEQQVNELFNYPRQHCPDVLVLGLLQINPPITALRRDLLNKLFKNFLSPHPNSQVILTHAWHSQSIQIKPILILSMAEWYLKASQEGDSEQSRLGRILDIAQDLKALNLMLNAQPFEFVIDLAILSSRREYLNLEKWIQDKIVEHREIFVNACVKFLQRTVPGIMGPAPLKDENVAKLTIPVECMAIILNSVEEAGKAIRMNQDLHETIHEMVNTCASVIARLPHVPPSAAAGTAVGGQRPVNPGGGAPGLPPNFSSGNGSVVAPASVPLPGRLPPGNLFPQGDLGNITRDIGSMNLTTGAGAVSSSAFSIPTLGPMLGSGPGSPSRLFAATAGAGAIGAAPNSATPSSVGGTQSPFSGLVPPLGGPTGLPGGGNISAAGVGGTLTTGPPPPRPALAPNNPIEQVRQGNIASLFPEGDRNLSKEVEDEANSYFQRIYNTPPNPTLPIDEVLELLKKYKNSTVQRETDVFFCMIKNLFEEYKFFPQYPDNALFITAELFGGIIEHGLVTMIHLGVALRFVLDALRKPIDSNMSWFGLIALDRFKGRLKEYSQYCQHVASIAHFKEFPAHLVKWVEYGAQAQEPPGKPTAPVIPPARQNQSSSAPMAPQSQAAISRAPITTTTAITPTIVKPTTSAIGNRPSIANTSIDTLLAARRIEDDTIVPPKEAEQDKIAFIFNNLSMVNLKEKTDNLKEILDMDNTNHVKWMAQYLVVNRASIEPNFHKTYSNFLEAMKSEKLYAQVIADTFKNIKILLDLDKTTENFKDRSLLKNQGHWLGLMLLARNKPILMVDLDMKQLIIEAYHVGQAENRQQELLFVVPFVAKVLESAKVSKVFKPPCPWTMGLMNLLAELHSEPELKLNLKFEIEVLCKHLTLEISELRPGNVLKDYQRFEKFLNFKDLGGSTSTVSTEMKKTMKMPENSFSQGLGTMGTSLASMGSSLSTMGASFAPARLSEGKLQDSMASSFNQPLGPSGPSLTQAGNSNMPNLPSAAAFSQPGSVLGMMGAPPQQATLPTSQADQLHKLDGATQAIGMNRAAEPKFNFMDINTSQLSGLEPHITVDSRIQVVKDHPEMLDLIKLAIEKSVTELMTPVIERAIKIAVTTCEQIVKKDFSLDHDENRMRGAAHKMVRNLTSGMAMITCRDHVLQKIKSHLKHILMSLGLRVMKMESIDPTANLIANDNVELACAFIQKKAVEKAIPEIDKRLNVEFELRKLARKEGRRYCDPVAVTYQSERMPEPIRSKVGQFPAVQAKVYEEFARNIPGFKPLSEAEAATIFPKPDVQGVTAPLSGSEESWAIIEEVYNKLQPYIEGNTGLPGTPHQAGLQQLLEALKAARSSREVSSIIILIGKAVENLMEGLTVNVQAEPDMLARFRDANLLVLKALADSRAYGPNWTSRQVTVALVEAREEIKWNIDAVDILIRSLLVNLFDYDKFLAACLEGGNNPGALNFAMFLAKIYLIDDRSNAQLNESDLFGTLEMLVQISNNSRNPPEGLVQLVDMIKINCERMEHNLQMSGPTSQLHSGIQQAREFEDPQGLLEKTEYLLREWVNMYHSPNAGKDSTKAFTLFVQQMNMHGLLKTDDLITRFFRMSTQMCVDLCYRALAEQNNAPSLVRAKCFHTLDAFVRLIALLVKHSGDQQNTITKVNLLNKVLGIVAGVLLIDHEVRRKEFQQVPYHRIFIMLYLELNAPDQILENINFQVLTAYCNMLNILRPSKAPGFAYAWLEIVSHRVFIGRILSITQNQKGWPMYSQLLTALFKFLSPFLRNAELAKPVQKLYRGTLRVLLVLLHDFPEFLCDYHYGFCDVIPPNCIQMRNLILSAFPRSMRLPDPFTPNLKVDMLTEISIAPRVVTNYATMIKPGFKKDLDSYLKNRTPVSFLSELRTNLQVSNEPGMRYNISMINALVMYVGTQAIQYIRGKNLSPSMSSIAHSSHMDIFQNLAVDMDTEGRYLFLNCIANQLRYPNSHTHYFSCLLLYLFGEANTEAIQEQITRVLLERLIVNRPHPWGLLITFIELIKNPTFKFWSHEFVQCAPEIQKLFESVAKSCMVASQPRLDQPEGQTTE